MISDAGHGSVSEGQPAKGSDFQEIYHPADRVQEIIDRLESVGLPREGLSQKDRKTLKELKQDFEDAKDLIDGARTIMDTIEKLKTLKTVLQTIGGGAIGLGLNLVSEVIDAASDAYDYFFGDDSGDEHQQAGWEKVHEHMSDLLPDATPASEGNEPSPAGQSSDATESWDGDSMSSATEPFDQPSDSEDELPSHTQIGFGPTAPAGGHMTRYALNPSSLTDAQRLTLRYLYRNDIMTENGYGVVIVKPGGKLPPGYTHFVGVTSVDVPHQGAGGSSQSGPASKKPRPPHKVPARPHPTPPPSGGGSRPQPPPGTTPTPLPPTHGSGGYKGPDKLGPQFPSDPFP